MAIGQTSTTNLTRLNSTWFDVTADWTVFSWYRPGSTTPSGGKYRQVYLYGDSAGIGAYVFIGSLPDTNDLYVEVFNGIATYTDSAPVSTTPSTWIWCAMRYTASTHALALIVDGAVIDTITLDLSTITFTEDDEILGTFSYGDFAQEYVRTFQAALTLPQLTAEAASVDAVITASLLSDTRVAGSNNVTDSSGNGRDWTVLGTLAYVAGPLPPVNITPATAVDLSALLPYSVVLDTQDAPTGTSYTPDCSSSQNNAVWYAYTAQAGVYAFSALGTADQLVGEYNPTCSIWVGTPPSLTKYLDLCATTASVQVPTVPGTTYYLQVTNDGALPALNSPLTLAVDAAPAQVAAAGSFFITYDILGYDTSFVMSSSTGEVLAAVPVPNGERGARVEDGTYCLELGGSNSITTGIQIRDKSYALIADVSSLVTGIHTGATVSIRSDTQALFYVGYSDSNGGFQDMLVQTVTSAGVITGDSWTLPSNSQGCAAICPSLSNAILYYAGAGTNQPIYRYDLVNDTALSDLVAGLGAAFKVFRDIHVLPDDTILVFYAHTDGTVPTVIRYDTAGSVLNTYTITPGTLNDICIALDGDSFWVWTILTGPGRNVWQRIAVSDGSVLDGPTVVPEFIAGVGPLDLDGDQPRFGISNSCPFLMTSAFAPVDTSTDPIRRLRRFEIAYDRHLTQFLRRIEFYCQPGTGLVTGQGSDPTLMFRLSKDGGITWSTEQTMSIGAMGDYTKRAYLIGLGSGRHLVGEISCSDPTTFALVDCLADLDGGTS